MDNGWSPQREGELPPQREDDGSALALRRRVGLGKGRGGGREGSAVAELHKYQVFIVLSVDFES